MKTIDEFFSYLQSLDVRLWVDGDQLRCNAPKGTLTPTLKSQVRERKSEIIEFLQKTDFALSSSVKPILPVPRDTDLPLSFAQQRLWFLQQLEPNNPFYNEHLDIQLTGALDIAALEQSLNQVVQRHETLRTTFKIMGGQAVQIIAPELTVNILQIDLQELPETEKTIELKRLATEQRQRTFDLTQVPLIRWTLLKLRKQEYVLLITMHHIIIDGWSLLGVFIHELSTFYQAFSTRKPALLPELPIQYADFAVWQRQQLQGEKLESQLSYWKQQLENAPLLLQLPTDRPQPPVQTYKGTKQSFLLHKSLTDALKALGKETEVTLFMMLLASFQILLYRYAGQEDIIIGSPFANRNRAEIEGLIGFFVNTLVLRTNLSGNPSFRAILRRVREATLGACDHQDLPFEKLVAELDSERNLNSNPLFRVWFILQNTPMPVVKLPGLTVNVLETGTGGARYDLKLNLTETSEGCIKGYFEYRTDLFEASTITQMAELFELILSTVIQQPDIQLSELMAILEGAQKQQELSQEKEFQELRRRKLSRLGRRAISGIAVKDLE